MSMEFGDRLLTYLSSLGLGTKARDLFFMQLPGTPYVSTAVILTGGFSRSGDPVHRRTLSVLHRNTHINSGLCAANSLYAALDERWNVTCPSEGRFTALTEPGPYTRDGNNHVVFTLSFGFVTTQQGL